MERHHHKKEKNPYRNQSALGQGLQWHCTPTASEHTQLLWELGQVQ